MATELALQPIKNGWSAVGNGWAVHGSSPDEARRKFDEALKRHAMIEGRPDATKTSQA